MIPIPRWARPFLTDRKCPVCENDTDEKFVEAIGIKEKQNQPRLPKKGEAVLIFEYRCPHCDQKTIWSADPDDPDLTPQDILQNILDTFNEVRKADSSKVSKSKISNKEFDKFKQDMADCNSHEDFLKFIGMDDEEISRICELYRKKNERKNKRFRPGEENT